MNYEFVEKTVFSNGVNVFEYAMIYGNGGFYVGYILVEGFCDPGILDKLEEVAEEAQ